jgi:putative acetyltransferase
MHIRPANPADADAICRVHVASIHSLCARDYTPQQIRSWTNSKDPDRYRRFMSDGETYYLAITGDDRVAGFASFKGNHVTTLYVDPDCAGRGAGRALLIAVETEIRRRGFTTLHLQATLTSVPFYRRLGYDQHEQRLFRLPDGVELPCVRMTKSLPPFRLTLRPATPADAARIHQIHADSIRLLCAPDYTPAQIASWTRYRSADDYRRALESGETNWLATLPDGTVAGYATYVAGELTALFVDPAHARCGAGRLLLAAAEAEARRHNLPALTLQSTLTSRPFYARHGYAPHAPESYTLPDGTPIPCVRMTKPLASEPRSPKNFTP